jgi:hypothetical protein
MMKAKTTSKFEKKRQRLLAVKDYMKGMVDSMLKREAVIYIKMFQDGIKNRQFRVAPLKPGTIKQKTKMGYPQPSTPLYGKGFGDDRSYINVLKIKKLKKGYKIYPSAQRHHKSELTLKELLIIHEKGATIKPKNGDAFKIPPRPILKKTDDLFKAKVLKLREKEYKGFRDAIKNYVRNNKIAGINKIIRSVPSIKKYED